MGELQMDKHSSSWDHDDELLLSSISSSGPT